MKKEENFETSITLNKGAMINLDTCFRSLDNCLGYIIKNSSNDLYSYYNLNDLSLFQEDMEYCNFTIESIIKIDNSNDFIIEFENDYGDAPEEEVAELEKAIKWILDCYEKYREEE